MYQFFEINVGEREIDSSWTYFYAHIFLLKHLCCCGDNMLTIFVLLFGAGIFVECLIFI